MHVRQGKPDPDGSGSVTDELQRRHPAGQRAAAARGSSAASAAAGRRAASAATSTAACWRTASAPSAEVASPRRGRATRSGPAT
jgi:hypothetical protein